MVQVFDTEKRASDYAKKMNKTARTYKYVVLEYKKSDGGNGKKIIVKKIGNTYLLSVRGQKK